MGSGLFRDLREYIEKLEEWGELRRVKAEVDPHLEVAEISRRVMYKKGPALLFENIKGYPGWRMATNIFRSLETIAKSLGVEKLESIGENLVELALKPIPLRLTSKLKGLREVVKISKYMPRKVKRGLFEDNKLDPPDLLKLPIPKIWPKDASRYITYGVTVSKNPNTQTYNMGLYRIQVLNSKKAAIHWQIHKRGARAWQEARILGMEEMPIAVFIGSDPATLLAAAMPTPYPVDEYIFTSMLRSSPIELVEVSNGILVPANSEVVIVGRVKVRELVMEGPFGDHTGYYTPPAPYPTVEIEEIMFREEPIYHFTVVGKPILEDGWISKASERIFLPILKVFMPEIVDLNMPPEGLFTGGVAIVSIKKRYPGHAKKVMMGLWGLGQFSLVKVIIVVDHDVNVNDMGQVLHAIATCVDPQRDVLIVPYAVTDQLDHTSLSSGYGSKLGIDATRKLVEENYGRPWPEEVASDPETVKLVDEKWDKYGLKDLLS